MGLPEIVCTESAAPPRVSPSSCRSRAPTSASRMEDGGWRMEDGRMEDGGRMEDSTSSIKRRTSNTETSNIQHGGHPSAARTRVEHNRALQRPLGMQEAQKQR
eukprot:614703-Rhodomonas_salina.1